MADPTGLFILGLTYGLTVCSLTCLPYLAPYLIGTGRGFKNGMTNSLAFLSGKLLMYTTLGGIAALIGHSLDLGRKSSMIMGFILVGGALVMPFVNRRKCEMKCHESGKNISLFAMGIGSSLAPCPPLAAVFMLAAQRGSLAEGALYGFIYGLGLLVSPLVLAGGGLAFISESIRGQLGRHMKYIEALAMLVMVGIGLQILCR